VPIAEAEQQMNAVDAGMDPVQRLQRDLERAVPRAGAEVPRVQLLQHPGDEGRVPQDLIRRTRPKSQTAGRCCVQRLVEIIQQDGDERETKPGSPVLSLVLCICNVSCTVMRP